MNENALLARGYRGSKEGPSEASPIYRAVDGRLRQLLANCDRIALGHTIRCVECLASQPAVSGAEIGTRRWQMPDFGTKYSSLRSAMAFSSVAQDPLFAGFTGRKLYAWAP